MTSAIARSAIPPVCLRFVRILVSLVALIGCAPKSSGVALLNKPPQDGLPGPPEDMAANVEDHIQRIDWGASADSSGIFEGPIKCQDSMNCGGQAYVTVRIVPSNFAPGNDWDKALSTGNGYMVAKISIAGGYPFDRFNMKKDDVAFLWVGAVKGEPRGAKLYTMKGGTLTPIFRFKNIWICRHPGGATQKPAVHFPPPVETCNPPRPTALAFLPTVQQASIAPFGALATYLVNALTRNSAQPRALDGLWISCSLGCCEAQFDALQ